MKFKKLFALLLGITLCVGMCAGAATAFADDASSKAMVVSSEQVKPDNYIYFGNWEDEPVYYQVLNDEAYLYSTDILARTQYNNSLTNAWVGSLAEQWCEETFFANAFASYEKIAVKATTKTDPAYTSTTETNYISQQLTDNHVFFLSAEEIESFFPDNKDRAATMSDGTDPNYWTRSRAWGTGGLVGNVLQNSDTYNPQFDDWETETKDIINLGVLHKLGVRPALYLDKEAILLMTVADGGKASGTVGKDALVEVPDATGTDWKLTLNDPDSEFKAELVSEDDEKVVISYQNAYEGEKAFVSVIIADEEGTVLYYGNIAHNSTEGTQEVTLPKDLSAGSYTLKVLAEVNNGNRQTDYGKIALEKPIEQKQHYSVTYDANGGTGTLTDEKSPYVVGDEFTVLAPGDSITRSGYTFVGWNTAADGSGTSYEPGASAGSEKDITLFAQWEKDVVPSDSDNLETPEDSDGASKPADPTSDKTDKQADDKKVKSNTSSDTSKSKKQPYPKTADGSALDLTIALAGFGLLCLAIALLARRRNVVGKRG